MFQLRAFLQTPLSSGKSQGPHQPGTLRGQNGAFSSLGPQLLGLLRSGSALPWLVQEQGPLHDA